MSDTMANTKAKEVLIDTLVESVIKAVQKPETDKNLGKLFDNVASIDIVKDEAKNSLLYQNLYN
jgi:hypothetical protein